MLVYRRFQWFLADVTAAAGNMVGFWHDTVVCLSECPSVTLCIVALRVGVGVESCTVMFFAGHFLFTSSDTFAVG